MVAEHCVYKQLKIGIDDVLLIGTDMAIVVAACVAVKRTAVPELSFSVIGKMYTFHDIWGSASRWKAADRVVRFSFSCQHFMPNYWAFDGGFLITD